MDCSNHREAEAHPSHLEVVVRPRKAAEHRGEAHRSSRIRVPGAEAAPHDPAR